MTKSETTDKAGPKGGGDDAKGGDQSETTEKAGPKGGGAQGVGRAVRAIQVGDAVSLRLATGATIQRVFDGRVLAVKDDGVLDVGYRPRPEAEEIAFADVPRSTRNARETPAWYPVEAEAGAAAKSK